MLFNRLYCARLCNPLQTVLFQDASNPCGTQFQTSTRTHLAARTLQMPFPSSAAYSELLLHGQYADTFHLHILMGGTSQYQTTPEYESPPITLHLAAIKAILPSRGGHSQSQETVLLDKYKHTKRITIQYFKDGQS